MRSKIRGKGHLDTRRGETPRGETPRETPRADTPLVRAARLETALEAQRPAWSCIATSTVSSPATEPTRRSNASRSMARATPLACPGGVRTSARFCAIRHSPHERLEVDELPLAVEASRWPGREAGRPACRPFRDACRRPGCRRSRDSVAWVTGACSRAQRAGELSSGYENCRSPISRGRARRDAGNDARRTSRAGYRLNNLFRTVNKTTTRPGCKGLWVPMLPGLTALAPGQVPGPCCRPVHPPFRRFERGVRDDRAGRGWMFLSAWRGTGPGAGGRGC